MPTHTGIIASPFTVEVSIPCARIHASRYNLSLLQLHGHLNDIKAAHCQRKVCSDVFKKTCKQVFNMPWPMRYMSEHLPVVLKSPCAKTRCARPIAYGGGEKLLSKVKMKKMTIRGLLRKDVFAGGKWPALSSFLPWYGRIPDDPWWSLTSDFQINLSTMWMMAPAMPRRWVLRFGFFVGKWSTRPPIEMSSTHMFDSKWASYEASPGQVRQL